MIQVLEQLTKLAEVGRQLGEARDTEALYETVFDLVERVFHNQTAALLLKDPRDGSLRIVRSRGYDPAIVREFRVAPGQGVTGAALESGQPQLVTETVSDARYIRGVKDAVSEIAAPLRVGKEIIGVLDMESREHRFSSADLAMFTTFADQVVTAIRTHQLHADLEERARKLVSIARIGQNLAQETALGPLLDRLVEALREALHLDNASIQLWDDARENLVVAVARGYDRDVVGLSVPRGRGITGRAAELRRPFVVADVTKDADYIPGLSGCRSEMAVPLILRDEVLGVLNAEHRQVGRFADSDLLHATIFADQAATAIGAARVRGELDASLLESRRTAERLALLAKIGERLGAASDLGSLLDDVLTLCRETLGFKQVAVLLPTPRGRKLRVERCVGYGAEVAGRLVDLDGSLSGAAFSRGEPVLVENVRTDPRYVEGVENARSNAAVPLRVGNEIVGVLNAESSGDEKLLASDVTVLETLASQVASAVRSARERDALSERNRRLTMIHRAACTLNTLEEPEVVIESVLKLAQKALGLHSVALLTPNADRTHLTVRKALNYGDVEGMRLPIGEGFVGTMFVTGIAAIIEDTAACEGYVPGTPGARCEMAVPLILEAETIGILDAEAMEPGAFTQDDLQLFRVFASQSATALKNARLIQGLSAANAQLTENVTEMKRLNAELESYAGQIASANESLERQIAQLTTLHEAGRAITSSLNLDETLEAILAMTSRIVGCTAGAIRLIDDETKEMRVRAQSGKQSEGSGVRAIVDLPLCIGDRTIGIFELVRETKSAPAGGERQMLETMASQAAIAIENARLFETTQRVYYETLKSLAQVLEARDDYTRGHSERVAELSRDIAAALALPEKEIDAVYNAALLHDIGKIGIRDDVLLAPRTLTPEERTIIEQHPAFGNSILTPLHFLGDIRNYVRHHHERWDGSGYPDGRRAEEIPLASRIIAVADTFDAMTSTRPYRSALSKELAAREIEISAGAQFDPFVVSGFLKIVGK